MELCSIIICVCFINLMVHYKATQSEPVSCQKINNNLYRCNSLISTFNLLSVKKNSTNVFIHSGTYTLNTSHVLEHLHNIRIQSNVSRPAVIRCYWHNNSDFDTGIKFFGVSNITINHLSIVGCGMRHNSTSYHGRGNFVFVYSAIFIQNSTNVFFMNTNISNSTGIGLLIYDTSGLVNITECTFTNNTLDSLHPNANGGGIHVEFTNCTPGLASCNPYDNRYNKDSKYLIDRCTFDGNVATYAYKSHEEEYSYNENFITIGTGGGVSLWLKGQAKNNSFEVISSKFIRNSATIGGGLHVHSRENTTYNHIKIFECSFIGNVALKEGGGLVIGNVIHQHGGRSKFNIYNISKCLFEQNQAPTGIGGGVLGFGSREPENTNPTNQFEIHNSSFVNNKAQFGSAIQINRQYFDSITVGSIFVLALKNCNFTGNNLHENSSIGAVAMSGVNIEFWGNTCFSNNTSTALIVDGATVRFGNDSMTIFANNSGLHGGAISLIEGASIIVNPKSTVIFQSNMAVEHGGAIYVELSTPFDFLLSHVCFVRYHSETILPSKWESTFEFINNTARQSNSSIFASTLQPCTRAYSNGVELFYKKPFYHYPSIGDRISTLPAKFNFLNSSDANISIVPGEIFKVPVILKDELDTKVNSTMFIATCNESGSPNVLLPYQLTDGTIQIAGKPNETCHLQLQTNTEYPASTMIQVTLLKCPPGLVFNDGKRQCQCVVNYTHQIPAISYCEMTYLQAYYNKYYWIGYESNDATDLIFGMCPYHYCYSDYVPVNQLLPRDANKTILDKFVCGDQRRTGLLCGQCIEGYSVVMNSPTSMCHRCKNVRLGILYLILSYILPVSVLFYIIMSYNIRITTGLMSAYLFFSQIISTHYYYSSLQGNTSLSFTISNIVMAIYSISNLEFFHHDLFSYCLFTNAGTVDILAFRLLLSFYPILLVLIYFLLRRYNCYTFSICKYNCFQNCRLSSKSVTHGISAFLVLCFAKINILAFGISKYTELFYINGTSYRKVVHLQGDIKHFGEPLYNIYEIGSLLTIVIIIIVPTIILLFHPILISVAIYFEWGESRFILLINKVFLIHRLKPVLDTFQGDYKDNLHFFAGLHFLLYRIIFFCIVVVASTADVNRLYLMITTYFLAILLIHVLTMPFKRFINNAAYCLMYFIMTMLVIIEHYFFSTGNSPNSLIWIEILLLLFPLVCIVLYCSWKLSISVNTYWKKLKRQDSSNQLSLDDYHPLNFPERVVNDDTNDYSDVDSM